MPRTSIIYLLAILLAPLAAQAESCADRVKAFDTYEDYDDNMKKEEGVSIFSIMDFSPHSSFEGLVISSKENPKTKVEIDVRKDGTKLRTKSWEFQPWKIRSGYLATQNMGAFDYMGFEEAEFVLRLTLNGKILCEDAPKEIQVGD
jgi:hypothetical protein